MLSYRPRLAIILTLAAGLVVLTFSWALTTSLIALSSSVPGGYWSATLAEGVFSLGILWGVMLLVSGLLLFLVPQAHRMLGLVVCLVSLASFVTDFGGLVVGAVLGIAGGLSAYVWSMPPEPSIFEEFQELPPAGDPAP